MAKKEWTEEVLLAALRERFCAPEWVFLREVCSSTGAYWQRRADAVAFNLWPSRGFEVHGFEIKTARGDWLSELKNPGKAEAVAQFCDRWWLVVSDSGIVQAGELPSTWGLLVPARTRLRAAVSAPKLEAKPLGRPILASILRRATEGVIKRSAVQDEIQQAFKKGEESEKSHWRFKSGLQKERAERAEKIIDDFERTSGLRLDSWNLGRVAEAVKLLDGCGKGFVESEINRLMKYIEEIQKGLSRVLKETQEETDHGEGEAKRA